MRKNPSIQVGGSPLNGVFSSIRNPLLTGLGASYLHPEITEISLRNKLRISFNNSIKFYMQFSSVQSLSRVRLFATP